MGAGRKFWQKTLNSIPVLPLTGSVALFIQVTLELGSNAWKMKIRPPRLAKKAKYDSHKVPRIG